MAAQHSCAVQAATLLASGTEFCDMMYRYLMQGALLAQQAWQQLVDVLGCVGAVGLTVGKHLSLYHLLHRS